MKRRIDDDRVHFGDDETTIPLKKSYLEEVDSLVKTPVLYKDGRGASMTVNDLVGRGVFSNPKDHHVLADLISYVSQPDAIVMDFFAGSGSTGHAVWELAASTESRRRFVLVQLPEQLDPDRRDHQAAIAACDALGRPRTIAELTKRRLTTASEDLRRRPSLEHVDLGFRVYELDSSSIREWQPVQEGFLEALAAHVDHIRSDRSEQDILYELLLRRGLDLCVPIETKAIAGKQVHSISYGTLFVCLAVAISEAESEALAIGIAEWHRELAPVGESAVIFRDSAFADDVVKTNLTAMLEQHGLTNVRSL